MDKNYFDYFKRPREDCDQRIYSNTLSASAKETQNNETLKYQSLFTDTFGHHVQFNFDILSDIQIQKNDEERFVTKDSLTSYFLDNVYITPDIYESVNTELRDDDFREFNSFVNRISKSLITRTDPSSYTIGSNRLSFLIGDVGTGKTLLLCKTIREIVKREKEKALVDENIIVALPVYFDFEEEMMGKDGKLLDVDDSLYGKIDKIIMETVYKTGYAKSKATSFSTAINQPDPSQQAKLEDRLRTLLEDGIRIILVLDNVDGYHYLYSKYVFFSNYYREQQDSTYNNLHTITTDFSQSTKLGNLGLCVVIAARRAVYQEFILINQRAENSRPHTGRVFQIKNIDQTKVITSRFDLFSKAITTIQSHEDLAGIGEDFKKSLSPIGILFEIEELSKSIHGKSLNSVIRSLIKICRYGNRDFVAFLSNLKLDHKSERKLIERFFEGKPHTLLLLYLANLKERYTQDQKHFPNLFLVDAVALKNNNFPDAHDKHYHTYWLKYLILNYVAENNNGTCSVSRLINLFANESYESSFDLSLVKLVLGSLSASNESRCIDPEPTTSNQGFDKISITERGKFLMSDWQDYQAQFCFSFTYLQLVVDDYLMSYPIEIIDKIYDRDTNLRYLFEEEDVYKKSSSIYLERKMKCVLFFLCLLKITLKYEEIKKPELFKKIRRSSDKIIPDFDKINLSIFEQYKRILSRVPNSKEILKDLYALQDDLNKDFYSLDNIVREYFDNPAFLEE